ncbi:hypothetical protein GoPhGRU1p62 [Gordonia phage GRU1]|uniref:Uncharacterized protein n=1 Tax=Gordonia phage GRU1 TaxID=1109710 RepID=G8EK21_9CAUD|nr:hypothetical protein GoPhGRU1p62 [Gordonia phage GRU1]AET09903.1 hypothetical protein [Gordonia phage GRU1]
MAFRTPQTIVDSTEPEHADLDERSDVSAVSTLTVRGSDQIAHG